MIKLINFNNRKDQYSWLNSVQDEICNTITKSQESLLPRSDQLVSSVSAILEGQDIFKGEIEDYSGNPVAIPGLKGPPNEPLNFLVNIEVTPRNPHFERNDDFLAVRIYSDSPHDFTTLKTCQSILSSDKLWESDEHSPLRSPEETQEIREMNARFLLKYYQPIFAPAEFYVDYNSVLNEKAPWKRGIDGPDSEQYEDQETLPSHDKMALLLSLGSLIWSPMPPLYIRPDSDGQYHYMFNRMLYSDLIRVSFGVFAITA